MVAKANRKLIIMVASALIAGTVLAVQYFFPIKRGGVDSYGMGWEFNTMTQTMKFHNDTDEIIKMHDYEQKSCEEQVEDYAPPWWKYSSRCKCIIIGKKIEYIGKEAFCDFDRLSRVEIASDVVEIGKSAFKNCNSLKTFQCPQNLKLIGEEAFKDSGLQKIEMNKGLKIIGQSAFGGTKLKNVVIPETAKYIGEKAFRFSELESIKLPKEINVLPACIFEGCTNLKDIRMPDKVKKIGDAAFSMYYQYAECKLKTLDIPNDVEQIGDNILKFNQNIQRLKIESKTIKRVANLAFQDINPKVIVEVPADNYDEYKEMLYSHGLPKSAKVVPFEQ
ncbi:Leucine rich repeat-containing protein [Lachnospiraceae bacterium XBB1006]|nr:Leucine rich repeat-containing protein [Lachnospiraceae bacterium XBB1006]